MEDSFFSKSEFFDELHPTSAATHFVLPPQSMSGNLHSSSFRIVDHTLKGVNPSPIALTNPGNSTEMHNQFLSPSKLREVSGIEDLSQITYIELSVNTTTTSVGNFGAYLPNLSQLCLLKSIVHSIRDLGTSLASLKVLWMANCSLKDLDGLAALPCLQELYVANNRISDVSLISLLSELEVLDLESNLLTDSDQLGYLCLCQNLSILNLANNPIANGLNKSGAYRHTIRETIPHLMILDELPFDGVDTTGLSSVSSSHSLVSPSIVNNWRDVNKGLLSPQYAQDKEIIHRARSRPSSAIVTSKTASNSSNKTITEDSSELTHGLNQVICGNPIRALRERQKRLSLSSQSSVTISSSVMENDSAEHLNIGEMNPLTNSRSNESSVPQPLSILVPLPPGVSHRPHTASDFRTKHYHRPNSHSRSFTTEIQGYQKNDEAFGKEKETSLTAKNKLLTARTNLVHSRRVYTKSPLLNN